MSRNTGLLKITSHGRQERQSQFPNAVHFSERRDLMYCPSVLVSSKLH